MEDIDNISRVLDRLTLDTLTAMEEYIRLKLEMEKCIIDGKCGLAATRYIMGQNRVSNMQLPTCDSEEFEATVVVNSGGNPYKSYDLEVRKPTQDCKLQDPIKWFGYLVPQTLYLAQAKFRQVLSWLVKVANVQEMIVYNCDKIEQLRALKNNIVNIEEVK